MPSQPPHQNSPRYKAVAISIASRCDSNRERLRFPSQAFAFSFASQTFRIIFHRQLRFHRRHVFCVDCDLFAVPAHGRRYCNGVLTSCMFLLVLYIFATQPVWLRFSQCRLRLSCVWPVCHGSNGAHASPAFALGGPVEAKPVDLSL